MEGNPALRRWVGRAAFLIAVAAAPSVSSAFHNQGYPCYACHSLKSVEVRAGAHSIRTDQFVLGTIPVKPTAVPWAGGNPVSCDFCHRSASDVPTAGFAGKAFKHPVDLIQTGDDTGNPQEITCNDCHAGANGGATPDNADLVPLDLATAGGRALGYGYPDHLNTTPGYSRNLSANPPHLTKPYWGSTLPGVNRANDTAFWTAVRNGTQDLLCWVCHDAGRKAPFTGVSSTKAVRGESTGGGMRGHPVRTPVPGALGAGASLPCYDCHASHGSVNRALVLDSRSIQGEAASTLAVTGFNQPARPYDDRAVCAGCHDTGLPSTSSGSRVEGLDPVDPFDSATSGWLHLPVGVADNLAASARNCLSANGGCHQSPHDPSVPCAACHAPGGIGPTVLWPNGDRANPPAGTIGGRFGSHLAALRSDNLSESSDWSSQCNKCHTGHSGPVSVPLPPASWNNNNGNPALDMRTVLGVDYGSTGGIHLGGTSTSGSTEAELCWNCHASPANNVSEWGFNTSTAPPGFPVVWATFPTQHDGTAPSFNFGWIFTDNTGSTKTFDWTAGWWRDEYDPMIRRRIASVHSASFDPAGQLSSVAANVSGAGVVNRTSPSLEGRAYLRCSYCHDVHDLNRSNGSVHGAAYGPDNATGKPWLRGRWVSNPYPPELPPRASYYSAGGYTTAVNLVTGVRTPRGVSTSRDRGGYFIDRNSGRPTDNAAMATLAQVAGICVLCHGTAVDSMKYYAGSKMWLAGMVNGHSNSTVGGTGANRRDLFSGMRAMSTPYMNYGMGMQAGGVGIGSGMFLCGPYGGECDGTNYPQAWAMNGYCSAMSGSCDPFIVNGGWYGGAAGSFVPYGGDYANWYGSGTIGGGNGPATLAHKFTCSKCHSPHATGLPALLTHNCIDASLAEPAPFSPANPIASNCHRKTAVTDGWHRLAPGQ